MTRSGICPWAPLPRSLFLTVSSEDLPLLQGFLEVSILESHLQRLPVNLAFPNVVQRGSDSADSRMVLQCTYLQDQADPNSCLPRWCICYCFSHHRFTRSGVSPSLLLAPAHKSQLAISSTELKGGQTEVMGDLDGNSGSRLGIHRSPRRAMNPL